MNNSRGLKRGRTLHRLPGASETARPKPTKIHVRIPDQAAQWTLVSDLYGPQGYLACAESLSFTSDNRAGSKLPLLAIRYLAFNSKGIE